MPFECFHNHKEKSLRAQQIFLNNHLITVTWVWAAETEHHNHDFIHFCQSHAKTKSIQFNWEFLLLLQFMGKCVFRSFGFCVWFHRVYMALFLRMRFDMMLHHWVRVRFSLICNRLNSIKQFRSIAEKLIRKLNYKLIAWYWTITLFTMHT